MTAPVERIVEFALFFFVVTFLISFFFVYSYNPKPLQMLGPDRRRTGKVSTRGAILTALILTAILTTVAVALWLIFS